MSEVIFTDQNFQSEVLSSDVLVLVDFWAPWCAPCRVSGPLVERVANKMSSRPIKIGKFNVDENQETPQKYGIMSIPTFLLFKAGKVVEQMIGVPTEDGLIVKLESHIN
ncbi:thioredoxin [Candidatus Uhrbacteria bacterium RIFCSPLOWO2_12_FULL_46_10]|uniref:Thioredoxin n=1 Tax=Candidatus Uhrbacteria bacterium RIFCSPLOWO2_01_FULL_47_25 TaxID=1802402 RepID=A0A1F7USC4_9BACT|nr:MAG: Thioredoxin [Parcubacteria group bacterium GW2011_GWA2_46_9]OGL59312.1 MAG: thioredoxin [Candidatus Uhrbacteria bacterium RIFCSPHIGHO2_01_FULL_46_23]OGL68443.1 MAG: thioredoxin [Candidatus Uhrbacteria bacterium RIFCSPHIGHO2_02_FULL_47_29]OGL75629.1 MAG: thioredoxin [Candidatus Uhrbacteria bacterium RIFCSPHIGHO2_12_FULL_46_13]OGL81146.1 MAG: thioredoxin [Candidatus Uhrbacteria bacterium RIFCSPLOWO2_01_FULL_47_25]OGL86458.1 MAG: thioredoxin [Candidatus Uhrbacteria bacterium RIFCSPLOWO2_0